MKFQYDSLQSPIYSVDLSFVDSFYAELSHLVRYITWLGNIQRGDLNFFQRLLKVIVSYLEVSDYPEEETRLAVLDALKVAMLQAWPRWEKVPAPDSTATCARAEIFESQLAPLTS